MVPLITTMFFFLFNTKIIGMSDGTTNFKKDSMHANYCGAKLILHFKFVIFVT